MEIKAKDVAHKFKIPSFKRFDVKKDKHPLVAFYDWIMKEMGAKPRGKNKDFTIDVSSVVIDKETSEQFKKFFVEWLRKRHRMTKRRAESAFGWEWLDIGPREFYDSTPKWAKPGHGYVLRGWKKPPNVKIAGNRYWLNDIEATEAEYKKIEKKFGKENLRISSSAF